MFNPQKPTSHRPSEDYRIGYHDGQNSAALIIAAILERHGLNKIVLTDEELASVRANCVAFYQNALLSETVIELSDDRRGELTMSNGPGDKLPPDPKTILDDDEEDD